MENYKLNILQRNHNTTGWHNSELLSDSDITNIKVLDSRNDKSLNAIPSPFARIHLFDAAFSLVYQDEQHGTNNSGEAYKKLVSDCFDVFELLFNWNSHLNEGKNLEIIVWNKETETDSIQKEFKEKKIIKEQEIRRSTQENKIFLLQEVEGYKENLVAETLKLFLRDGIFKPFDSFHILKLDGESFAGSSPLTGFFTTPNDLSKFKIINPFTKRAYFSRTRLFSDRDIKIKKFIYDFIIRDGESVFNDKYPVTRYLNHHSREISNINLNLTNLNSPNNSVFGNSIKLKSSKERPSSDYFQPCLIRLNYKINESCFYYPSNSGNEINDYLLPLTMAFFEDFDISKIPSAVRINEKDADSVEVTITKENQKFSKTYQKTKISEIDGNIIELSGIELIKLNLGIFPFIKVINSNSEEISEFNDFYRLMLVCKDNKYRFDNDDFSLEFGKDKILINSDESSIYKIYKENRTILQKDNTLVGSTYYSTNFCFDYIKVNLPNIYEFQASGMIVPKWKEKKLGDKGIDYAIDFGTTTTFVAYTDDQNHQSFPKKFELKENEVPIALLNKPKDKRPQLRWIDCYMLDSNLPGFEEFFEVQKQEFIPSIFNSDKYDFPFRTAVYEKRAIPSNRRASLLNSNIAFSYQKDPDYVTSPNNEQHYIPNLKWNIKKDNLKESIEIFIEELFHLLRLKTLLNDGDPKKSKISWFSPLSFTPHSQFTYSDIWGSKYEQIFKGQRKEKLKNITESEAPYYYFSKIQSDSSGAERIEDTSSVLTLDIGGGTTDLMYFQNGRPIIGSSFHFGANIIWGDGYGEFNDSKFNGIYLALKESVSKRLSSSKESSGLLKSLNEKLNHESSEFGSDEILNFWIANDSESKVIEDLKKGAFKLSYLLHLSALLFHSFKLLKYNLKPAPKCLIFTGNGSKYVDLIQTKEYIEKISKYFLDKIFEQDSKPQVIMPSRNRKEATCFGGLYQPFEKERDFEVINYLGFEKKGESFRKYIDIDQQKDSIFDLLSSSFKEFIDLFFMMNDNPDLSFRSHFGVESNLNALKNYMLSKCKVNLTTGYDRRRKTVESGDEITDSIFFYPIIGIIYQINKLSRRDLEEFIPKTVYYALPPDEDNSFDTVRISNEKNPDSIFYITVEDLNPGFGELSIVSDGNAIKRAMAGVNTFLKSVCDFDEFPDNPNQSIEVLTSGKVIKENGKWFIKEKIKIKFV